MAGGGNFQNFYIDTSQLVDAAKRYQESPAAYRLALMRTVNRVGSMAGTKVNRTLADKMGLPLKELRPFIQVFGANRENLVWSMRGVGRPISLRAFGATQRKAGVSARPWGERRVFRGTFIVASLGGSVYVRTGEMARASKGRYRGQMREQIKKLWGPGVPKEMASYLTVKTFEESVKQNFAPRLDQEMRNALRKLKG
jgi:hypothetical protein